MFATLICAMSIRLSSVGDNHHCPNSGIPDVLPNLVAQGLQHKAGFALVQWGAMHQPAGGLVDDGEIIVQVKDVEHVVLIVTR